MTRNQWLMVIAIVLVVCIVAAMCLALVLGSVILSRQGVLTSPILGQPGAATPPVVQPQATRQIAPTARPQQSPASPTRVPQSSQPRGSGNTLNLLGAEPVTLDPALVTDATSAEYIVEIFSGLVTIDPDLKVQPDIAEKWDISQDGRVYTFHLRPEVKFHNGKAVTANDFKWSIERVADPRVNSPVASLYLDDIVGVMDKLAGRAQEVKGVRVVDDRTLEITIDAPKAYFLAKLTYPTAFALDRENVEKGGRTWTDRPNGTGPFKLAEFKLGERLVLERNASFYGEPKPSVDKINFNLAGGSAMIMYENGELDATPVGLADIERVLDPTNPLNKELTVVAPTLTTFFIGLNNKIPPFDDLKVRQAFNHAIDKQTIAEVIFRKSRVPANGILPPTMPGYNPNLQGLTFDPDKAKKLLAESKYKDARNLPDITLTLSGGGADPGPVAQAVVGMLEQNLGVKVAVQLVETATFNSELRRQRFQMYEMGWSADYPDPQDFLDIMFHSKSANNYMAYSNPMVDQLVEAARTEKDQTKRFQLYQQAEQIIVTDAPWIPIFFNAEYWLTKPYVKGMIYPPMVIPKMKYVSIQR